MSGRRIVECIHIQQADEKNVRLEFTRGLYLHFDQISRVLNFVAQHPDRGRFYRAQLGEATGLSDIQAGIQAKFAAAMDLLVAVTYRLTEFGRLVHVHDPFFEDSGTLWVCHYALAAEPKRLLWSHVVNCLWPTRRSFSAPDVRETLGALSETHSARTLQNKVLKEARSVFNAYTEQAFQRLDYVRETTEARYALTDVPGPVPPGAFLAVLLLYRDRFQPGASGLEVTAICTADHGPGRLLNLDELHVRTLLDRLHQAGQLTVEARANLDQVRFRPGQTWSEAMRNHFTSRP